jgi:hypothetical protein
MQRHRQQIAARLADGGGADLHDPEGQGDRRDLIGLLRSVARGLLVMVGGLRWAVSSHEATLKRQEFVALGARGAVTFITRLCPGGQM